MQKKIIALAIAAAFSAPAFADSTTTVYGVLDAGYGDVSKTVTNNAGVTTSKNGQTAIAFSQATSSRLGFLNKEDLGNGMTMALKVETGIGSNPASAAKYGTTTAVGTSGTTIDATSLGNRELNLLLSLGEGTSIKAGYGSTPVRDFTFAYDAALGGNLVGNMVTMDSATGSNRATSVDVIHQFGPVKGTVGVLRNTDHTEGKTDTQNANGYQLAVQYAQDALSVAFAYQSAKTATPAVAAVASNTTVTPIVLGSNTVVATEVTTKVGLLAATYDFGVAKAFGEYANVKIDDAVTPAATGTGKRSFGSLGVDVPFGAVMGFAQVSFGSQNQVTTANTASNSRSTSGYTVGAKYTVTKTTWAYASLGETKLKEAAGAADKGIKISQYALGLVHTF
jgi:predicted porin